MKKVIWIICGVIIVSSWIFVYQVSKYRHEQWASEEKKNGTFELVEEEQEETEANEGLPVVDLVVNNMGDTKEFTVFLDREPKEGDFGGDDTEDEDDVTIVDRIDVEKEGTYTMSDAKSPLEYTYNIKITDFDEGDGISFKTKPGEKVTVYVDYKNNKASIKK